MEITLKYGHGRQTAHIAEAGAVTVLEPGRSAAQPEAALLAAALAHPIGSRPLRTLVSPGQRVAIVTSDVTRPCPSGRLLPLVMDELTAGGVALSDVTVVFGLGTHRAHSRAEQAALAGPAFDRVRCIDSDPADVVRVGTTARGTPVEVFRPVHEANVRVLLGVIEYHYFAGYSGGLKALVPGVCTEATIQANHRRMTEPGARTGNLEGNPVRADIDEAGQLIGADFLLNVVLDDDKRIVAAVAGDPIRAHRAGCAALDAFGRATVDRPADLVIVSAGGYPKDLNLYQAQKALDNAKHVVRKDGVLLLVAECAEGLGHHTFEEWMLDPGGPEAILARIRREFVIGGHKAAAIAQTMQQAAISLVSALPPARAAALGFRPFATLEAALASAQATLGPAPSIVVMPEGGSLLPQLRRQTGDSHS